MRLLLHPLVTDLLLIGVGTLLLAYGAAPHLGTWRRIPTCACALLLSIVAGLNSWRVHSLETTGTIQSTAAVSTSTLVSVLFSLLLVFAWCMRPDRATRRDSMLTAASCGLSLLLCRC